MIWLTWRQFRAQSIFAAAALVVAAAVLTILGIELARQWTASGAAACPASGDCSALDSFVSRAEQGWTAAVYILGSALIYLVPPLVGVFWGAPLVARELESGTQRLVWNQSVTRTHWLIVKLALIGTAGMALAGLLSLAATWSSAHLDQAGFARIEPALFGARGIVPIAYAAFAFALGVTAGMVLRRTVPAMATTLAVYAGAVLTMALGLRGHLLPPTHKQVPLDTESIHGIGLSIDDNTIEVHGDAKLPGAWVLHNDTVTAAGKPFTGPADPAVCGPNASPKSCMEWLGSLGLKQDLVYQPAGRFWALQWTEAGVFLALTALLVAFGFWWLRKRTA